MTVSAVCGHGHDKKRVRTTQHASWKGARGADAPSAARLHVHCFLLFGGSAQAHLQVEAAAGSADGQQEDEDIGVGSIEVLDGDFSGLKGRGAVDTPVGVRTHACVQVPYACVGVLRSTSEARCVQLQATQATRMFAHKCIALSGGVLTQFKAVQQKSWKGLGHAFRSSPLGMVGLKSVTQKLLPPWCKHSAGQMFPGHQHAADASRPCLASPHHARMIIREDEGTCAVRPSALAVCACGAQSKGAQRKGAPPLLQDDTAQRLLP